MNLNDPFGRLAHRHQTGYESMRDNLRNGHIDTPQAALEVIGQIKKRALKYIIVGLALFLPVAFLLPKALPVTLSLALFLIVWVANSAHNGQRYIKRYIDEELKKNCSQRIPG